MTIRPIVICGEPVLHKPTRPITEFGTPELDTLIQDMPRTLPPGSDTRSDPTPTGPPTSS